MNESLHQILKIAAIFTFLIPAVFGQETDLDLTKLSTYYTGVFDESAAEIISYDAESQRLFFTNANSNSLTILDITNPAQPTLVREVSMTPYGGGINSVAVYDGLIAAAVENDPKTDNGRVVLMDSSGFVLNTIEVGVLPDMIVFSPDGKTLLTANEGEPNDDYSIDPEGSVSIIDLSGGFSNPVHTLITFESFNDKKSNLLNRGIRLFGPNASVAQDLEPEYIAVTEDGTTAYVSLQENNGLAVIDLTLNALVDILPLGYKDHNAGTPVLNSFILNELINMPDLGSPVYGGGQPAVTLGGFSGLYFDAGESTANEHVFYTVPDRGPNDEAVPGNSVVPDTQNLRPYKLPGFQAQITRISFSVASSTLSIDQTLLTGKDGTTPISGKGNIPGFDEIPVTYTDINTEFSNTNFTGTDGIQYHALEFDPYGGDFEGIVRDATGNFWLCDENRPSIYQFNANGVLLERYVPIGSSMLGTTPQVPGYYGAETLPEVYSKRRANRGFEAIAYDANKHIIYAFIQSPIETPDASVRNKTDLIRILAVDAGNGMPVGEYAYLLENNADRAFDISRVDKIGDAVYLENGVFLVLERDSSIPGQDQGKKYIFKIDLKGATNILGHEKSVSLESYTSDELSELGINFVHKTKVLNLPTLGYESSDKVEGIAILPGGTIAILNDNDFGLAGAGISDNTVLGLIRFNSNYGLDASNRSEDIEIKNWQVLGMYLPDAIDAKSINGETYIFTANEGDSRDYDEFSEEERIGDLILDPDVYPDAVELQLDENLGRLLSTTSMGDYDQDGDVDQLFSFGARSFSIWDAYGNLVWDSGDDFEQRLAILDPDNFNSTNSDNNSRKSRSDDKGPEPEAIKVIEYNNEIYALIGLERQGGIMVYNVSDPKEPFYVNYVNNRDFTVEDPMSIAIGDLGVEAIIYIPSSDSPSGVPLVVTANEVSGTVTIFNVGNVATSTNDFLDLSTLKITAGPNPFQDQFEISYQLAGMSNLYLNLHDFSGKVIRKIHAGQLPAGANSHVVSTKDLPGGSYLITVVKDGKIAAIPVVKAH